MIKFLVLLGASALFAIPTYAVQQPGYLSKPMAALTHPNPTLAFNPNNTGSAVTINGAITSITSTAEKVIAYRHQNHMWETSDGAIHVFANRGGSGSGSGLVLYSSFNEGQSWNTSVSIPNTNSFSTLDGFLRGDTLYIAVATFDGNITFRTYTYNSSSRQWSTGSESTIYSRQSTTSGSNPSIAVDANGVFWSVFATASLNLSSSLRLHRSSDSGQTWSDTGITFGQTSSSLKRSARLLTLSDRMAVVYTNNEIGRTILSWAWRFNSASSNSAWTTQTLFNNSSTDVDPFGSHFSAIVDPFGYIQIASRLNQELIHIRIIPSNGSIIGYYLTSGANVIYMQITSDSNGKLYIVFNSGSDTYIFDSLNSGNSWSYRYFLSKPSTSGFGNSANFDNPRMIVPQRLLRTNRLPVLRQFVLDGLQRLVYY